MQWIFNDCDKRFFVKFVRFDISKKRCKLRKHMTKIVQFVKNEKKSIIIEFRNESTKFKIISVKSFVCLFVCLFYSYIRPAFTWRYAGVYLQWVFILSVCEAIANMISIQRFLFICLIYIYSLLWSFVFKSLLYFWVV